MEAERVVAEAGGGKEEVAKEVEVTAAARVAAVTVAAETAAAKAVRVGATAAARAGDEAGRAATGAWA